MEEEGQEALEKVVREEGKLDWDVLFEVIRVKAEAFCLLPFCVGCFGFGVLEVWEFASMVFLSLSFLSTSCSMKAILPVVEKPSSFMAMQMCAFPNVLLTAI